MLYQLAADFIVLLHFVFIVFAVAGGVLVFKWRRLGYLHVPAAIWAALIIMAGWICPLTPIENMFRQAGGGEVYSVSFIERYLMPVIYPSGLSREIFIAMGVVIIVINVVVYTILFIKRKNRS